jgi:PAS domain S-box-containing protein
MNTAFKDLDIFKRKPSPGQPAAPQPPPAALPQAQVPPMPRAAPDAVRKHAMPQPGAARHDANGTAGTAAVTVDPSGKIISVDNGCSPMFGWKDKELVGQQLRVLLREGSDNHLKAFLQHDRANSNQILSLRVIARRMDGREFSASMTRLAWTADAALKSKSVGSQECWTAVFRELAPTGDLVTSPAPMPVEDHSSSSNTTMTRMEDVSRFQGSPAALRSANEELQKKLEAMAAEAWKKSEALSKAVKEREELSEKLATQQAEYDQNRATLDLEIEARKVLESQLQELMSSSGDMQRKLAEQGRGKEDLSKICEQLREEVEQAKPRVQKAEAALKEESARADGYKTALTNLQHAYDEVNSRVGAEKQALTEAKRKVEELESVVRGTTAEAERANAELERLSNTRGRLEDEWRGRVEDEFRDQVKSLKAAAERAEAAHQQEISRANRLERDLANLRQNYDEVSAKLTAEVQASADAKRRAREVDSVIRESEAEVERANALVQKYTGERTRLESEWHEQLGSARAAAERAEAAQKQEMARATRFERELAALRQNYEELEQKLSDEQDSLAESKRRVRELENTIRDNDGELERAKAAVHRQSGDRTRLEAEWHDQVNSAKTAAERAEAAYKQESSRAHRLDREVLELRQQLDDVKSKYSAEKAATSKTKRRVKDLEKQLRDRPTVESSSSDTRTTRRRRGHTDVVELAATRAVSDHETVAAKRRAEELEDRLRQNAAELARAKAALESRSDYRNSSSSEELVRLREKNAAHAAELSEVNAEVEKERTERRRVEQRFVALSGQLQELHEELKKHLHAEKASQNRVNELEQKLRAAGSGSR